MNNGYQYIDPDNIYTDPKTGVMRNLANITEPDALIFTETAVVTKRSAELKIKPIKVLDSRAIFAIHKYLFQDIYDWAGKRRTVEISKGGKQFFPVSRFDTALSYIDGLIVEYKRIGKSDKKGLCRKLAEILAAVNYLHPLREGNGRVQRELLRLLALEKGWKLSLNPPDNIEIYNRYMAGTISGEIAALEKLIFECMS